MAMVEGNRDDASVTYQWDLTCGGVDVQLDPSGDLRRALNTIYLE
jgi:hypothetical protein